MHGDPGILYVDSLASTPSPSSGFTLQLGPFELFTQSLQLRLHLFHRSIVTVKTLGWGAAPVCDASHAESHRTHRLRYRLL